MSLTRGDHYSVRKEKEMTYDQTNAQRERAEENFKAWLTALPAQELRRYMAGPWTTYLLSTEEIEELYQVLKRKEASPPYESGEDLVEVGQD
jgi:hypothetical protein